MPSIFLWTAAAVPLSVTSIFAFLPSVASTSSLVFFNSKYYLILNNLKLSLPELKHFSCTMSEFASRVKNETLLERKLKEYGRIIIPKNAISTCLKYFNEAKS